MKIKRVAAKLPEMVFVCVVVLGIYVYVFLNDISVAHSMIPRIYLPAIGGGIAGLISSLLIGTWEDMIGGLLFFVALILTGIYQGLSGITRLLVAIISLLLQFSSTVFFTRLYIAKQKMKKRKKQKGKTSETFAQYYNHIFTILIIIAVLQLVKLTAMLILPLTLFKSIPVWIIILGAGTIIFLLIFSFGKKDIVLLVLLIINIVTFAISLMVRDSMYLATNIILLIFLTGTIVYTVKQYRKITEDRIRISKTPLVLFSLLVLGSLITLIASLFI